MYTIKITKTLTTSVPCPDATTPDEALHLVEREWLDNHYSALATDADWQDTRIDFHCIPDNDTSRYVLYYPALKPKVLNKTRLIAELERMLQSLKRGDEARWTVGHGMGFLGLEDTDRDGTTLYSRHSIDEFHKSLNDPELYKYSELK